MKNNIAVTSHKDFAGSICQANFKQKKIYAEGAEVDDITIDMTTFSKSNFTSNPLPVFYPL